jgi:hypothetical protein
MDDVFWHRDPETYFAPLSETLIWMTAIADAMGKIQEPEYSGIAYARNCVLHGFVIVSDIFTQHPREPSPLKADNARMVFQGPAKIWGFTKDPEPHDPAIGKERNRDRRAAYNAHVAEHSVQGIVPRLLLDLGVNIWAVDDSDRGLRPRRPLGERVCHPATFQVSTVRSTGEWRSESALHTALSSLRPPRRRQWPALACHPACVLPSGRTPSEQRSTRPVAVRRGGAENCEHEPS